METQPRDMDVYNMSDLPSWQTGARSPFQVQLMNDGFTYLMNFPAAHPLSFFQILGYGLASHAENRYEEVDAYLSKEWKSLVSPIREVFGQSDLQNPQWWTYMGETVRNLVKAEFLKQGKSHLLQKVEAGYPLTRNDPLALMKIAEIFKLCLVWVEHQREGNLTHKFHQERKGETALFLYLAEEAQTLYFLYHKDFCSVPKKAQHPHYMIVGGKVSPYAIGQFVGQEHANNEEDKEVAVRRIEVKLANSLVALAKACADGKIPTSALPALEEVKTAVSLLSAASNSAQNRTGVNLEAVQELVQLPISTLTGLPKQHDLYTCAQADFPDILFVYVCNHKVHEKCIQFYIESQYKSGVDKVLCPFCCNHPLPEKQIQDLVPNVFFRMSTEKGYFVKKNTTQAVSEQGTGIQGESFQCQICGKMVGQAGNCHGCPVCVQCSSAYLINGKHCPYCQRPFTESDMEALSRTY